jgi:hypothetical protein
MKTRENNSDPAIRQVVWLMALVMVLSLAFGIAMFIPAEHRADKLAETMQRYQARNPDADQTVPAPRKRPEY